MSEQFAKKVSQFLRQTKRKEKTCLLVQFPLQTDWVRRRKLRTSSCVSVFSVSKQCPINSSLIMHTLWPHKKRCHWFFHLTFMLKMSTIHTSTYTQTTTPLSNRCRDDGVVQQPPLSQQTFLELIHIMHPRTVGYKGYKDAVVHRIQIRRIRWPHLWRWTLAFLSLRKMLMRRLSSPVNDMISLMSTLRHQVRDVRDT